MTDGSRKRVLVLTKLAPWRLNGGALIRNYWMIRALTERYDVDLFIAEDAPEPPAEFRTLLRSLRAFPRPSGKLGVAMRALDALHPKQPFYAAGSVTPEFADAVAAALRDTRYLAVQTDLNMVGALPQKLDVPLLFNAHNCEFQLQMRRAQTEKFPLSLLIGADAQRLRILERATLERAACIAVCSYDDQKDLAELAPSVAKTAVLIPNGVDTAHYAEVARAAGDPRTVLITGSMDWRPNQIGLQWFLGEVLPHLRASGLPLQIRVAGRMGDALVRELSTYPEIVPVANPADMRTELKKATIVVAPITASSGTRLRILEAWAAGRPVVTTSFGALGLDYTDGEELITRDKPAELSAAIIAALADLELRSHLRERALTRVAQYDWQPIGARLLEAMARLEHAA